MILNPKDNKTLGNLMAKFHKDGTVWIIVPVKKAHNYILRAKAMEPMEPKVKGESVVYNKADKADLLLNNLSVSGVNSVGVIIKKEP
jgi:hypothetical protein